MDWIGCSRYLIRLIVLKLQKKEEIPKKEVCQDCAFFLFVEVLSLL